MRRSGWSLVEVLMVLGILGVSLTVLVSGRPRFGSVPQEVRITGRMLVGSIMETVGHRLNGVDRRFFAVDTSQTELMERLQRDEWQTPFRCVDQPRVPVLSPDGRPGGWAMSEPFGPKLTSELTSGSARTFLSRFSYEIQVGFDVRVLENDAPRPIDADGDSRPEIDLARVDVRVFWQPETAGAASVEVGHLSSLFSYPDKSPGLGDATQVTGP